MIEENYDLPYNIALSILITILVVLILMAIIEYLVALLSKNKKYGLPDYKHAPPPLKYSKCYYFYVSKCQLKATVTALKDTHTLKRTYYDKDVKSYVAVFRKKTVK